MKTYRIVKNVYRNLIAKEDGQDSLSNIISQKQPDNVVWQKELEEEIDINYFPPRRISMEGYLGSVDINFELQVFEENKNEWLFLGFLREKFDD
ncbi:MAG TPA: hypothetical protein VFD16_01180 [Candidatus Saccharimonadales bacterium]|nr:hypothetical protein [Candidatus Saccharimonadales bacterium]